MLGKLGDIYAKGDLRRWPRLAAQPHLSRVFASPIDVQKSAQNIGNIRNVKRLKVCIVEIAKICRPL
jgi:hypothetical protein